MPQSPIPLRPHLAHIRTALGVLIFGAVGVLAAPTAEARCLGETSIGDLSDRFARGEEAFKTADPHGVESAWLQVEEVLPCVTEVMSSEQARDLHVAYGLVAVSNQRAPGALTAAQAIDAAWRFPEALVPDDPTRYGWASLELPSVAETRTEPVPAPAPGVVLRFDGVASLERQTNWPTVLQIIDEKEDVRVTAYLEPGDPLPSYPHMAPHGDSGRLYQAARVSTWSGVGVLAAGVGAAATTGLLLGSSCTWDGGMRPSTCWDSPVDALPADQQRMLTVGPVASGALLGLGTAGLVGGVVLRNRADEASTRLQVTGTF